MTHSVDHELKIILLGESGVGKTSLTHTFTTGKFQPHLPVTVIADCASKAITLEGRRVRLRIWDTSSHEWFKNVGHNYYDGFLLVYDTTVPKTFDALSNWLRQLRQKNDAVMALIFEHLTLKILRTKNLVIDTEVNCEHELGIEHPKEWNVESQRLPQLVDNRNFSSDTKKKADPYKKRSASGSKKDINCHTSTPSTEPASLSTDQLQELILEVQINPLQSNAHIPFNDSEPKTEQSKMVASCEEVNCDSSTSSGKILPDQSVRQIGVPRLEVPKLPPDSHFRNISDECASVECRKKDEHSKVAQSSSGHNNLDQSLGILCYDSSCLLSFFILNKNR